jgi:hypothetical protein
MYLKQAGSKPINFLYSLVWMLIGIIAFVYGLQLLTLLGLNTDSINLLRMLLSAKQGEIFYPTRPTGRYPIGYPPMLLPLALASVANSFTFV